MGFKRVFHKTCLAIRKHSPQILAVAGAISTIAGVVLVCKTATETAEEVNQAKDEIQQIKDSIESEAVDKKDGKKSMHAIMWRCFKKVGPKYILPATLTIGGLFMLLWSGVILAEWLTGTTVAYRQLEERYSVLEEGVRREYGEEALQKLKYGLSDDFAEIRTGEDENASTGQIEAFSDVVDVDKLRGYTFIFDKNSSRHISDATICDSFLVNAEKIFDQKFHKNGVLFLWEVLRDLDIQIKDPAILKMALNACWVDDPSDPTKDCCIRLRPKRVYDKNSKNYRTGFNPVYILDPNWDTMANGNWDVVFKALK